MEEENINEAVEKLMITIKLAADMTKEPKSHIINELRGYLAGRIAGLYLENKKEG